MTPPPALPGSANITDSDWETLESAAKHAIPPHIKWQIETAIEVFLGSKHAPEPAPPNRQLRQMASRIERLASVMNGQEAALASAKAQAIRDGARRRRGRPGTPELDRLLVDLALAFQVAAPHARYADWLAFLRCGCDLGGVALHSAEALEKRAKSVCKGLTPGAPARQKE